MSKHGQGYLWANSTGGAMGTHSNVGVVTERRRKPRIYKRFPALVSGEDASGNSFESAILLDDLSSCGLHFRIERNIEQGVSLHVIIRLSLPKEAGTSVRIDDPSVTRVAVKGKVVRAEKYADGSTGVGFEIVSRRFI